jgi:flagellar motor switch protein FliM
MSEVLSQSEIDALLAAISSGEMSAEEIKKEEPKRKVRNYDFKRALRFSKDHLRSLYRIHETFARYLTTYFSAQLRTFVQIQVLQVEQLPYEEFIRSIPQITVLNVFEARPLVGRMVLEVNPSIAFTMLDRLLGGTGIIGISRSTMTEIETIIMERIFKNALNCMREAWKSILELEPTMEQLETNPQFMQIASPNETIALISLSTRIGDSTGMISLCIPHIVLEPMINRLTVNNLFFAQKKQRSEEETSALESRVQRTQLPVIAELGATSIIVQDLLDLTVGDVIELHRKVTEAIPIKVEGFTKFLAKPGQVNGKRAVQIAHVIPEGGEIAHE